MILSQVRDKSLDFIIEMLEKQSNIAMTWFENNFIKINSDKCKLLISGS